VTPKEISDPASPTAFAIINDQDLVNVNGISIVVAEDDGTSAADYDPTMDMREDKRRDDQRHNDEVSSGDYNETHTVSNQDILPEAAQSPAQKIIKSKDDFDMFAEDDMFAEELVAKTTDKEVIGKAEEISRSISIPAAKELDIGMLDNWDDAEGYYKVILGELLNGRYHVQANLGRGMFSGVVRATDVTSKKLVAIKLIRNNETMYVLSHCDLGISANFLQEESRSQRN
jgi:serine/threonine-protein kinase PRP4